MPYYVKCPFYHSDQYPTKAAKERQKQNPKGCYITTICECARVNPPTKDARRYLYENFCTSDKWKNCTIAQMTMMKYEEKSNEAERRKQNFKG